MITLKRFFSCKQSAVPNTFEGVFYFSFEPYYAQGYVVESIDPPPTGFAEILDSSLNVVGYLAIGAAAGNYEIIVRAGNFGGTYTEYLLEFEFTGDCAAEQQIDCCDDNVTIKWLGVEGAIKQWSFPGVRNFKYNLGDANTFKNANRQLQYSERKNIYAGKRVSTAFIELEQREFLEELSYCIQAWEYDGTTHTPIAIANDSFPEYSSKDKFFELSVQYVFAAEKIVQTQ
jgi:hypothetical protein